LTSGCLVLGRYGAGVISSHIHAELVREANVAGNHTREANSADLHQSIVKFTIGRPSSTPPTSSSSS
jgi:hypothetical protein